MGNNPGIGHIPSVVIRHRGGNDVCPQVGALLGVRQGYHEGISACSSQIGFIRRAASFHCRRLGRRLTLLQTRRNARSDRRSGASPAATGASSNLSSATALIRESTMGHRARPRTNFGTVILGMWIVLAAAGAHVAAHLAIGGFSQFARMFRPSRVPPPPFDTFRYKNDATFGSNLLPGTPPQRIRADLLYKHPG